MTSDELWYSGGVDIPPVTYSDDGDLEVASVYARLAALDDALLAGALTARQHEALTRSAQTILRDWRATATRERVLRETRALAARVDSARDEALARVRAIQSGRGQG